MSKSVKDVEEALGAKFMHKWRSRLPGDFVAACDVRPRLNAGYQWWEEDRRDGWSPCPDCFPDAK